MSTTLKVKSTRVSAGHYELAIAADVFTLLGPDPCYPSDPGCDWTLEGEAVEAYFSLKREAIEWLEEQYNVKAKQVSDIAYYWHNGNLREEDDCTLRAVEYVTGIGYKLSQKLALANGYRRGAGMNPVEFGLFLEAAAVKEVQHFLGHKVLQSNVTVIEFAARYTGKWVLWVKGHAIGLVDGRLDRAAGYENEPVIIAMGWDV